MDSPLIPPWSWLDLPAPHQREYNRAGVWTDQTLADIAIDRALREPDAAMLVEPQRTWRLGELVTDATALAASLGARGLRPGEVIAFQLPNWGEAAVVNLAASIGLIT
jgi:non-ribosomal peptide synthetase component E (peptide arylation enzyme)